MTYVTILVKLCQANFSCMTVLPGKNMFCSHLPEGQGPWQVVCKIQKQSKLCLGKQNLRAVCEKGKLEFTGVSSSPVNMPYSMNNYTPFSIFILMCSFQNSKSLTWDATKSSMCHRVIWKRIA